MICQGNVLSAVRAVAAEVAAHDARPSTCLAGCVLPRGCCCGADFQAGDGALVDEWGGECKSGEERCEREECEIHVGYRGAGRGAAFQVVEVMKL